MVTIIDPELRQYEEDLKQMRPHDDDLMREMFRNDLPLAQIVLRIIMNKPDLVLVSQETQYDMKRLLGARSICLDVFGIDEQDQKYNIEVQRADKGARPRRARYHSSAMDIEFLEKNRILRSCQIHIRSLLQKMIFTMRASLFTPLSVSILRQADHLMMGSIYCM